ncbi:MAG: hypothetical protein Q8K57_16005 [Thiobacillus sp.]|nr:hypothetical protein [Thiobacillus sp.]MDP1926274.1 hypothetical protein [Thiobacillus sp.]MDP3124254.1 hypothetical protein [Thiobacillus sp.]
MKIKHLIFGERSLTKVAALFATKSVAEDVAQQVKVMAGLDDPQVYVVGPPDGGAVNSPAFSRKLEPEQAGIWRTLVRAHVVAGTAGVIAGVLVYLGFLLAASAAVKSSPGVSLVAMVFFGGLIGLLLGGLLTARPDHVRVITAVRRAIRRGRWAVVIHPVTQLQLDLAMRELRTRSDRVVRSL